MAFKKAHLKHHHCMSLDNAIDFAVYLMKNVVKNAIQTKLMSQPYWSPSVLQLCAQFALSHSTLSPKVVMLILLFL